MMNIDDLPPTNDEIERQMHLQLNAIEKQLLDEHHNYYYQWMKHLVTLSSGGLTILVSMRNSYIPDSPTALWLLSGCWLLLCLSLLSGLMALYGQAASPLDAALRLKTSRKNEGDLKTLAQAMYGGFVIFPHKIYRYAYFGATLFFGIALVSLLCFAVMNRGSSQKSPEVPKAAHKIETTSTEKNNKAF
jgi:hypothetical protein